MAVALIACVLVASGARCAALHLRYQVTPGPPTAQSAAVTHVRLEVTGGKPGDLLSFQMPRWSPGDYHVQDFAQYVRNVAARSADGSAVAVNHPDANTWQVVMPAGNLVLSYDLPNEPPGIFCENVLVQEDFAFYNGPALYLYIVGHKNDACSVSVHLPAGWQRVLVPLPEDEGHAGVYDAPDYDTLADAPLLAGKFVTKEFQAAGRPHTAAFFRAISRLDVDGFVPILRRIVEEENRLMGGPPYERYVFFFDVDGPGGGLEHLNSCRIAWPRGAPWRIMASMAAHEFFHLWNVKRIRPDVLGPFDYINPPRTPSLWFCEGVTSYYGDLSLCRAGLITRGAYLAGLARSIGALQRNPARRRITAEEASMRVWDEGNSAGYGGLSYYLKGELMGLCLDLRIRQATDGRRSLDDVMRFLYAHYALPKRGYSPQELREAVVRIGGPQLGPFYDRLTTSTDELPYNECLAAVGLRLREDWGASWTLEAVDGADAAAAARREEWLSGSRPGGNAGAGASVQTKERRADALSPICTSLAGITEIGARGRS
ncbi:MAG: M61 family metallopeptidase [Chthonomonadales bacterium]